MTGWILSQVLPYLLGGLAIFAGLWGYGRKKKNEGKREVLDAVRQADAKEAAKLREKLDAIPDLSDDAAIEFLRKSGRLRD